MMFKLFILALALILALVAAAPPNPNKPDEKEVKEEKADEYEYEDVPESRPCDARESCKDPQEDQPRPGPSQPKKQQASAPKWPGECRGRDCLGGLRGCREPGPRCAGVENLDSDTDEE